MKKIFLLTLIIIMSLILASCGSKSNDEVIVGMELAYPPFEMTDEQGKPSGISVEMAYALGDYLGKDIKIENMAWSGLIPALTSGKIDMILSSMTITEEREKTIDFSDPYCKSYLAILFNKNSKAQSIEDLNAAGMKLAVKRGSTAHIYAVDNLPLAELVIFEKEDACVLEVVNGNADAFIYDQMTIFKNWQNYPDYTRADLSGFQNDFEYWGIAVREGDKDFLNEINSFISEYKENGGFDTLSDKYLTDIKNTFKELNIPFFF